LLLYCSLCSLWWQAAIATYCSDMSLATYAAIDCQDDASVFRTTNTISREFVLSKFSYESRQPWLGQRHNSGEMRSGSFGPLGALRFLGSRKSQKKQKVFLARGGRRCCAMICDFFWRKMETLWDPSVPPFSGLGLRIIAKDRWWSRLPAVPYVFFSAKDIPRRRRLLSIIILLSFVLPPRTTKRLTRQLWSRIQIFFSFPFRFCITWS
jgi:hypothetical protein